MVSIRANYASTVTDYDPTSLEARLETLADEADDRIESLLCEFLLALDRGDASAVEQRGGACSVNAWVKRGILSVFGHASNLERGDPPATTDVLPRREVSGFIDRGVRTTPGSTVRAGTALGDNATVMGGAYVNIGSSVGPRSMIDSNVTVGSCCQIGADTHIGANTLLGGVLEPIEDTPVIIGDDVSVGGGSTVTSGFEVGDRVVVAENTLLTPRIEVYDLVEETVHRGAVPSDRRVFQRSAPSSLGDQSPLSSLDAVLKPIAVAIPRGEDPVAFEDQLRVADRG